MEPSLRSRIASARVGRRGWWVSFAIFAVLVAGSGSIWALVALSAVYGIGEAFFRPALSGVIPQCVSQERLQEAYGMLATTPALGIAETEQKLALAESGKKDAVAKDLAGQNERLRALEKMAEDGTFDGRDVGQAVHWAQADSQRANHPF